MGRSGLSKEEIDRGVREAEANAAHDREFRERIEARNRLDSMIYTTGKFISDDREKIAAATLSEIEGVLSKARTKLDAASLSELNDLYNNMAKAIYKASESMYRNATGNHASAISIILAAAGKLWGSILRRFWRNFIPAGDILYSSGKLEDRLEGERPATAAELMN